MSDCSTESFKPHARMMKTKAQLRAEAVERLRELDDKETYPDEIVKTLVPADMMTNRYDYAIELDTIIDLLTDEPMDARRDSDGTCPDADGTASIEQGDDGVERSNDGVAKLDAQARAEIEDAERSRAVSGDAAAEVDADTGGTEKTPQEPRECGRITFTDTREMLEEDVRQYANPEGNTGTLGACWERKMIEFLDRQAAITQDETIHDYNIAARESGRILRDEIAELQADRDELQRQLGTMRDVTREFRDERDEWKAKAKTQRNNFEQATGARKHWQRKYENLKATSYIAEAPSDESELARELGKALGDRDMYRDKLGKALAERDMYRDKLGEAVDAAQQIVKLMEVGA